MEELKGAELLKGGRTEVYRVKDFTVKITKISKVKRTRVLPYFFGPSKARREYRNLRLLKNSGFQVPDPVFYWEFRRMGVILECGLVEKFLKNAVPLRRLLKEGKNDVLKPLGVLFRRLHDSGFFMRDLTYGNFLIRDRIYLVDVSRMVYFHSQLPLILRLEDLSKVDSTGHELLILLAHYWDNEKAVKFSATYILRRKLLRKFRKKISHALNV